MRATTGLPARNQRDEAAISTTATMDTTVTEPEVPTFAEAAKVWARIGLLSFGGPAGQIALMHKELVEDRRWNRLIGYQFEKCEPAFGGQTKASWDPAAPEKTAGILWRRAACDRR